MMVGSGTQLEREVLSQWKYLVIAATTELTDQFWTVEILHLIFLNAVIMNCLLDSPP